MSRKGSIVEHNAVFTADPRRSRSVQQTGSSGSFFHYSEFLQSCPHLAQTGFFLIFSPFSAARAAVYISRDARQVTDRRETRPVQTRAERSRSRLPALRLRLSPSLPLADSLAPAP